MDGEISSMGSVAGGVRAKEHDPRGRERLLVFTLPLCFEEALIDLLNRYGWDSPVSVPNGNANMHPVLQRTYQVVVAATWNMGIGKDGKLPWMLRPGLKFFKEVTMATSDPVKKNAVVMGRKTWESIPLEHQPLPGRLSVVLTRSGSFDIATAENVVIYGSMASALELLAASPYCLSIEKVFVIGGGQILRLRVGPIWLPRKQVKNSGLD
ncbi:hypothetical protein HHK36_011079 [Tetracentron sinense]|uniref:dihydrofolate reductase n=1 Tax=Tetracentron sinense TaxID=13715 RepID=A0A834ZC64_TETSI|nr:hypothetical protein HHK36_011079 [Tetracentron sinense]